MDRQAPTGIDSEMAKLIHTIELAVEKSSRNTVSSTRETTGRRYVACLVATTTEASLRIAEKTKVEMEAKVVATKKALDAEIAKWGVSVEQAEANHKERSDRWYNNVDGVLETGSRLRKALEEKTGRPNYGSMRDEATADMIARGFVDPYDKVNTDYGVVAASFEHTSAVRTLEYHVAVMAQAPLGSQAVISWHQSEALAQKALGARDADACRKRGDKVEIRTDISVRERATRAKKAEAK